uniref:Uncharacterized protein n=1 Tax=Piliocolobus tephrosceles TaxID=591936 RepID=A0A8C9LWP3_9PRIM
MLEQSKDLSDPNFAAEASSSEVHSNPGVSVGIPLFATLAEPQSPPRDPTTAPDPERPEGSAQSTFHLRGRAEAHHQGVRPAELPEVPARPVRAAAGA